MNLQDDDFTLFGLNQAYRLDRQELDQRWRALQAEVHPDRFAAQGTAAQRVAMQWAVRTNEAYSRLKDPLARAAYLCELRGVPVDAESNTAMPPEFLTQQMSWREALDEAPDLDAVAALDQEVRDHRSRLYAALETAFDQSNDPAAAAHRVRALMFVEKFLRDVDRRLEAMGA